LAETINGLYKTEVIRRRGPWRSLEAVEFATLEWVDWFNNRRLLEPIGGIPPAEAEARYYAQLKHAALAAWLKPTSLRQTRGGSHADRIRALTGKHRSGLLLHPTSTNRSDLNLAAPPLSAEKICSDKRSHLTCL